MTCLQFLRDLNKSLTSIPGSVKDIQRFYMCPLTAPRDFGEIFYSGTGKGIILWYMFSLTLPRDFGEISYSDSPKRSWGVAQLEELRDKGWVSLAPCHGGCPGEQVVAASIYDRKHGAVDDVTSL